MCKLHVSDILTAFYICEKMVFETRENKKLANKDSLQQGFFLPFSGTWPMALELGISRSFTQNWEFLAK